MIDLQNAICYDIETIVNAFTCHVQPLFGDWEATFEISEWRDDRELMFQWFRHWNQNQTPMISFNGLAFDYPVLHFIDNAPNCSVDDIYAKAQEQIHDHSPFKGVWESERFAPQIDLLKLWHFDNKAKMTSLKALQFNMRCDSVMEMPIPFDVPISREDIDAVLIPYNRHDVAETKRFAQISLDAIKFRIDLKKMLKGDVVNWNDTKIGAKFVEQALGDDLCYEWVDGRKRPRQTNRESLALSDVIFPFIRFETPEFQRVLAWLKTQVLTADEMTERLRTKGVFTSLKAHVGGIDFCFGTGGLHGSVSSQRFIADAEWGIYDIDVSGMYPANMIANRLYPEHLGERFVDEFGQLPVRRAQYKKGTPENSLYKLAGNGTFGNTNNIHSVFLDPAVTMKTTVNGQLEICMLAEWILTVPTVSIIQANTDGITYRCRRDHVDKTREIRKAWEAYTRLALEEVEYSRMWIRDVNSYVAESTSGKIKQKGAFWYPDPDNYANSITNAGPPAWHKDLSNTIAPMAAVEHMVHGIDIEKFIYSHQDKFDFMCRAKVDRASQLWIGDEQVQRICRYYIAHNGGAMRKVSPPVKGALVGQWKRKNGISDYEYMTVLQEVGDAWDARIHTQNKSKYVVREMGIEAGHLVRECNRASDFDWGNLNREWYVEQAKKLVIA